MPEEVVIWNREEFTNTGWIPKEKQVQFPSLNVEFAKVYYLAEAGQDPWDRVGMFSVNDVELLRLATPFGATISAEEDVSNYILWLAGLKNTKTALTTFVYQPGWYVTVKVIYDVGKPQPQYFPVGVINWELTDNGLIEKSVNVKNVTRIRLYATGHRSEEGVTRTVNVYLNGSRAASVVVPNGGWYPGKGRVEPHIIDVPKTDVSSVKVEIPGAGRSWLISLALESQTAQQPQLPNMLLSALSVFLGATLGAFIGKRI